MKIKLGYLRDTPTLNKLKILCSEQLSKLWERRHVAIREADEPIHRCSHQGVHEQLASHRVGAPNQHHLHMESREMGLWVLRTNEANFGPYGRDWYHGIHDLLRERHRELPGQRRRFLIFLLALILQIPVQFLIRSAQFFVCCPRRSQISMDAFLVCSRCSHFFLKGLYRFHNLLQGEPFAHVWCNRSLPYISHPFDLSGSCWWDNVLDRAPRWASNVPVDWLEGLRTSHDIPTPDSLCLRSCLFFNQTPEITKQRAP